MSILIPLTMLAIAVLIHFTFVNINIGLGVYSYVLRWKSLKNSEYEKPARKTFKFLIASEIVSGIWGTIITVVLAGFWPTLLNIATTVLFIPLTISLLGIAIRIPSIAGFWYTWDRIGKSIHMFIGFLMILGGFMIPAGFRYIFVLIDYPLGVTNLSPIQGNPYLALYNPLYPPLLLHTWIGALSIGFFAAATGLGWSSKYDKSLIKYASIAAFMGALLIIPQGIIGFWFWSSLSFKAQYLFNSMSSQFLPVDKNPVDVSWTFIIMVLAALYLLTAGIIYCYRPDKTFIGYTLAPISILSLIMGEFTHDYGRIPYMVIMGNSGLKASLFVNNLLIISLGEILLGLIPILAILIIFIILLYLYLARGFLTVE